MQIDNGVDPSAQHFNTHFTGEVEWTMQKYRLTFFQIIFMSLLQKTCHGSLPALTSLINLSLVNLQPNSCAPQDWPDVTNGESTRNVTDWINFSN